MGCGGSKGPVYSGDDRAGPLNVGDRVYAGNWGHAIGTVVKLKRQAGAYNNLQKKKNDIAEIEIDGVPESELRKTTRDGSVDEELIGLMAGSTVVVCERHVMKHFPVKLPQGHPGLTKKLPYGYPSPANIDRIRRDLKPKGLEIPTSPGSYLTALDKAARYFDGKEGYKPVDTSPATEANACSKFVEVQENLWLLGDAYLNDGVAELRKKEAEAKAEAARQAEEEAERARQRKADAAATAALSPPPIASAEASAAPAVQQNVQQVQQVQQVQTTTVQNVTNVTNIVQQVQPVMVMQAVDTTGDGCADSMVPATIGQPLQQPAVPANEPEAPTAEPVG